MDAVRAHLVRRGPGLVVLLTPPFDRSPQEPGYIKGYPPGIRENGGQYTHAAVWMVMAMARLGFGDEAAELFHMLNPVNHTRTAADVERYKAEPYVLAGDVFAHPAHAGRAGWSWYTGSAGLDVPGRRREHPRPAAPRRHDRDRPVHPASWPAFSIAWRLGSTRYAIEVENPARRSRGVVTAVLDGVSVDPCAIPVVDDGATHEVKIVLGERAATARG